MFHGRPRHDDVKMVVEENDGNACYFAKCRGFFRDGNGDHFVAVQLFNHTLNRNVDPTGHAHGRERKSGMGVTFLLSHCRKGVEWCVNRREIVGLVGIAELD